jgi:hypothetical protein
VLLGVIYLLNVVPWLGFFLLPRKVFRYSVESDEFRAVKALALLHAGLLMGLGILVLSSPDLIAVFCVALLVYRISAQNRAVWRVACGIFYMHGFFT